MQKPRSGSLKRVWLIFPELLTKTKETVLIHSILLAAGCCSFCKGLQAQHYNLDNQVLISLMQNRCNGGIHFNRFISNTTGITSAAVPLTVLAVGAIKGDRLTLQKGLYMVESLGTSFLVTFAMKDLVNRRRPFVKNPYIIPAGDGSTPSFPSGHTSMAFATATSLTIAYPKWYVAVPAYAWATTVGYSRMYLGVHYPSDVAAGAIIGAGSAWLTHRANQWLQGGNKPKKIRSVY